MAAHLHIQGGAVFTIFLFMVAINHCFAITCLSCENEGNLANCKTFTECASDEACYLEKYLNEGTYELVHRAGCRNVKECKIVDCAKDIYGTTPSTTVQPTSKTTQHARFKRDLVVCTECCYNDTCNVNGCGSSLYDVNEKTLHCFEDDKVTTNKTVQNVKQCQSNEKCKILINLAQQQGPDVKTRCCDTPLCNTNPLASNNDVEEIVQQLACPPALVKTPTTSIIAPTTPVSRTSRTVVTKAPTTPLTSTLHVPTSPSTTTISATSTSATTASTSTATPTTSTAASTSTTTASTSTATPSTTTISSTSTSTPLTTTTTASTSTATPSTMTTATTTTTASTPSTTTSTSTATPSTTTTTTSTSTTTPSTTTMATTSTSTTTPSTTTATTASTSSSTTSTTTTTASTSTSTPSTTTTTTASTSTSTPSTTTSTASTSTTAPSTTTASTSSTTPSTTPSTTTASTSSTTPSTTTTTATSSSSSTTPTTTIATTLSSSIASKTTTSMQIPSSPSIVSPSTVVTTQTPTGSPSTAQSSAGSSSPTTSDSSLRPAFTTVPNGTLSPGTTTLKQLLTLPPKPTRCAVCAGPPEACEFAFFEDSCFPPNNYCINNVTNLASGKKLVDRKCGDVQTCYKDWYLGTSDDDKCRKLTSSTVLTYAFECTYCCIKDSCNVDLHPKADSLYSPKR